MNALARSIVGVALTAAAVYFLDPVSGRQRRVLLQDQYRRTARRIDRSARHARRDLSERYFASRAKEQTPTRQKSDRVVSKTVRGAIRQSVAHPEAIEVAVDHGHVFLRGDLMPHEHQRLLDELRTQPGVLVITDHLNEYLGNGESSIEDGHRFRSAAGRGPWGTTGRVLGAFAGGALLFWGIRERRALGEFGSAVAEEFHRAMDGKLREGLERAKGSARAAGDGLSDAAQTAGNKAEEGVEWAESTSADVIEEYAQKRRRSNVADATH
jgi:hypothetical protein